MKLVFARRYLLTPAESLFVEISQVSALTFPKLGKFWLDFELFNWPGPFKNVLNPTNEQKNSWPFNILSATNHFYV